MADAPQSYDRIKRQLGEAEGYLLLNLPTRALEILHAELDVSMALCGVKDVKDVSRSILRAA